MPRRPTRTSPRDCARAGAGRATSRAQDDWCADVPAHCWWQSSWVKLFFPFYKPPARAAEPSRSPSPRCFSGTLRHDSVPGRERKRVFLVLNKTAAYRAPVILEKRWETWNMLRLGILLAMSMFVAICLAGVAIHLAGPWL